MNRKLIVYYIRENTGWIYWNSLEWGNIGKPETAKIRVLPLGKLPDGTAETILIRPDKYHIITAAVLEVDLMIEAALKTSYNIDLHNFSRDVFDKLVEPISIQQYAAILGHFRGMEK